MTPDVCPLCNHPRNEYLLCQCDIDEMTRKAKLQLNFEKWLSPQQSEATHD